MQNPAVDEGQPEQPAEAEHATSHRPDPRQPAYDAVYANIRNLGERLPPDVTHRNAMIWRAVQAALDATPVGRCISSHCVEGDHILEPAPDEAVDWRQIAAVNGGLYASVEQDVTELQAALERVKALAKDMRTWCSPRGVAVDYAQRIEDAVDGTEASR